MYLFIYIFTGYAHVFYTFRCHNHAPASANVVIFGGILCCKSSSRKYWRILAN